MNEELIQYLEYNHGVLCSECQNKVLDPEKKLNQVYLKGKCPSCNKKSGEKQEHKQRKSKAERRREKLLSQRPSVDSNGMVIKSKNQLKRERKAAARLARHGKN